MCEYDYANWPPLFIQSQVHFKELQRSITCLDLPLGHLERFVILA